MEKSKHYAFAHSDQLELKHHSHRGAAKETTCARPCISHRFASNDSFHWITLSGSEPCIFQPWLKKLPQWIGEGKQPYLMIHTADNHNAPQLAQTLYQQLAKAVDLPSLAEFPATADAQQLSMF